MTEFLGLAKLFNSIESSMNEFIYSMNGRFFNIWFQKVQVLSGDFYRELHGLWQGHFPMLP